MTSSISKRENYLYQSFYLIILFCLLLIQPSFSLKLTTKEGYPQHFRQSEYQVSLMFFTDTKLNLTISLYHSFIMLSPKQLDILSKKKLLLNQLAHKESDNICSLKIKTQSPSDENKDLCYVSLSTVVLNQNITEGQTYIELNTKQINGYHGSSQFDINNQQLTISNTIFVKDSNFLQSGIFGLSNPDRESSFGVNLTYDLYNKGIITTIVFGICVSQNLGILLLGDLDISSDLSYQKVFLQNIYDFQIPLQSIQVDNHEIELGFNARISYQQPYLLVKQAIKISENIIKQVPNIPQNLQDLILFVIITIFLIKWFRGQIYLVILISLFIITTNIIFLLKQKHNSIEMEYEQIILWINTLPKLKIISKDSKGRNLILQNSPIFICHQEEIISSEVLQQVQNNIKDNHTFKLCTTYKQINDSESSMDAEIGNWFLQDKLFVINVSKSYILIYNDSQCLNSNSVQEQNSSPLYFLLNIFQNVVSFLISILILFFIVKQLKGKQDPSISLLQQEENDMNRQQIIQNNRLDMHFHND